MHWWDWSHRRHEPWVIHIRHRILIKSVILHTHESVLPHLISRHAHLLILIELILLRRGPRDVALYDVIPYGVLIHVAKVIALRVLCWGWEGITEAVVMINFYLRLGLVAGWVRYTDLVAISIDTNSNIRSTSNIKHIPISICINGAFAITKLYIVTIPHHTDSSIALTQNDIIAAP